MIRRIAIVVLFPVMLCLLPLSLSHADDAVVLPKGIFKTKMKGKLMIIMPFWIVRCFLI